MATTGSPTSASPLERHTSPVARSGSGNGGAVAALILGVVGVVTSIIPIVGVIVGVIATVRGRTARSACRKRNRDIPWQATAGLILGIVAICASLVFFGLGLAANL